MSRPLGDATGRSASCLAACLLLCGACAAPAGRSAVAVTVGSKAFTEGVVLGEIITRLAASTGAIVTHRDQLGGTRVVWNALLAGDIDIYAEYTGTIREEILAGMDGDDAALRDELARRGVRMSAPLGFNNTYVIGMLDDVAEELAITDISDLRDHPLLRFGFSNEFMDRDDGWPGLRERYELPQRDVRGLDHDLAYRGLDGRSIDAIDLYSTDAEIRFYGIRPLRDDRRYFADYRAVLLSRADLAGRAPQVWAAVQFLEGAIQEREMVEMNARAKLDRVPEAQIAAEFLAARFQVATAVARDDMIVRLGRNLRGHLALVGVSLLAAIIIAVPLGIVAARFPKLGQGILAVVGIVQTIPSLALFVFMIPFLGIGAMPAIAALFLYSLLPIVANTHAGLISIPGPYRESAAAIGLPRRVRLRLIELPLASGSILAGIKTSAVINVGTATLAALIGAQGFGQPILTGIRLADNGLIMEGAVPAAILAVSAQGLFGLAERWLVPRGLRLESGA